MPGAVADVNRPPVIAATADIDNHASGVYNQCLLAARPNTVEETKVTLPSRSAERDPRRRGWLTRLRRSRGGAPRSGPVPYAYHGSWTVDRVARALTTACDSDNRGVPAVNAVVVGQDTVWFHLGTPDERPPGGWTSDHNGRVWHAELRRLQSASVAESLDDPYPQLVSLGSTDKGFVLLNLVQAGGIIALEGDARQARGLAQDWIRELSTSPWSRGVQVVRIGFRPGTEGPDGVAEAKTMVDAEALLADDSGGVLLLAGLPGGRDRERVYKLADDPMSPWSVVVVGRVDHPRWRFSIDSDGIVDTGLLDGPVAHRLDQPLDLPVPEDTETDPGGQPAAGPGSGNRPPAPLFTRRRILVTTVVLACVSGAAVFLAQAHTSPSAAPRVQASDSPVASRGTASASPTALPSPGTTIATASLPGAPLVNQLTGKCLSGSGGTDGTPLILWPCKGNLTQKWDVVTDGTIRTNGLCMDAAWGSTTAGTVVQIARCSGNPAQQFSLRNGTIYSADANMCVDELKGGSEIQLFPCTHNTSEAFKHA